MLEAILKKVGVADGNDPNNNNDNNSNNNDFVSPRRSVFQT